MTCSRITGVIFLLLVSMAGCEKSPQQAPPAEPQAGVQATPPTEQKESPPAADPAAQKESQAAARKKLEELGLPDTDEAFLDNVQKGSAEAVRQFLAAGMSPNLKDKYGSTALMLAAEKGHTDTVSALLAGGAGTEVTDTVGNTALIWAVDGNVETIKALLAHGANVNAKNQSGKTPLLQAAQANRTDMVEALKQAGAEDPRR